ncbi:thiol reductant ABC exporter subunit CydD [Thermomonospora cellulosilytica]|uniref:ATP-binding cassette subfamily C protein CydD n=1 Tax=Thermomonospora cellulosilytica TaxID=1411118 RepID=A0A7W3N0Z3_9ACTN|nr:thiol reductant ABC exporter subunit CydD [Thermomonospora cellulosilytica]MBA9005532.1 ATP-binding cassette subfamily C protein CydD [Thermomonospora cellulosilytica]
MRPEERRLLRELPGGRGHLAWTGLTALAVAVLVVLQAELLAGVLADGVMEGAGADRLAVPLALFAGVLALRALLTRVHQAAAHHAAARLKRALRARVLRRTQELGPARLSGHRAGELTTALGRGLDALDPYLTGYLPQLFLAAAVPVAVLARLGAADPAAMLTILVTLPLIPIFGILIGLQTRAAAERQWGLLSRLGGHFLDVVAGLPTLRVFGRAEAQVRAIRESADAHRAAALGVMRVAFLSALVLELVATFSVALIAVPVGLRLLDGGLDLRTGMLVLLLAPEAYLPLRAVGTRFHEAVEGVAVSRQLFGVLDTAAPAPPPGRAAPPAAPPGLRLDRVTVRYEDRDAPALDAVDLDVAPGERVALVGASGAGKSTVLAVLLGLAAPAGGTVALGGPDGGTALADLDLERWRRGIGWLPQRAHLFAGTVADNIRLGVPDATDEQVRQAAREAMADGFITALPDGYRTVLGERGTGLSGGQRQRLALARVFLRCHTGEVSLLLLDEPGAHLDQESEAALLEGLRRLMDGRTAIVVAHRPAVLGHVDRIVRLADGRIVADEPAARTGTAEIAGIAR